MSERICSVEGCPDPVCAWGWCSKHYQRWTTHGDPLYVRPAKRCSVEGCGGEHKGHGYCDKHYQRWKKHGDPLATLVPRYEHPTYESVHDRLRAARGRAADHACVDCGGPAEHWSYDHADPDELVSPKGWAYSLDLDRYAARCQSCHKTFDVGR